MNAGARPLADIFNGNRILEIPFFQRSYVWEEDQWKRLLDDIETMCITEKPYFIGSFILKQQKTSSSAAIGDVRTVIDGQQRMTTLCILMKAISLRNPEKKVDFDRQFMLVNGNPVLSHNRHDEEAFNEIMCLDKIEDFEWKDNLDSIDKIRYCFKFFYDNLEQRNVNYDTIRNALLVVNIDIDENEDEQQIFDAINSLGVRLTTAELLKNYFFDRKDIKKFDEYWFDIFEKDDETIAYWDSDFYSRRNLIDWFFYSYLQIKVQDSSLKVLSEDRQSYLKVERLFESYKDFIGKYLNGNKDIVLSEIKEYADVFRKTFNPQLDYALPAESGIERLNALIFDLDTATLIPYVLFVEYKVKDDKVREKLYGYLESYIMRRLVTRCPTRSYNKLFYENLLGNRVLTKESLVDSLARQEDTDNTMPSDEAVINAFHNQKLSNKYATGILYMIESKIRTQKYHSTDLLSIKKYSLEHMMPKKWEDNWGKLEDENAIKERNDKLLTLGNLTIITSSLNSAISNADWTTKKEGKGKMGGLKKYAAEIETASDALEKAEWNEDTIDERASELANQALKIWPIN